MVGFPMRTLKKWIQGVIGNRRRRLRALQHTRKRRVAVAALNQMERELEHLLATLPAGPERRQANTDLFFLRTQRAMAQI